MSKLIKLIMITFLLTLLSCGSSSSGGSSSSSSEDTSPNPASLWTTLIGDASAFVEGKKVTISGDGDVYIIGNTDNHLDGQTANGIGIFISKFNINGEKQWTKLLSLSGSTFFSQGVQTDSEGNLFVALKKETVSGVTSILYKFNSDGEIIWEQTVKEISEGTENITIMALSVDSNGNAYVGGFTNDALGSHSQAGDYDLFIMKYDPTGSLLASTMLGVDSKTTLLYAIAISGDSLYATGTTNGDLDGETVSSSKDLFIIQYDLSLNKQWTKLLGADGGTIDSNGVTTDSLGNVYITGHTEYNLDGNTKTGNRDLFLTKYNSSGEKQWTKLLGVTSKNTYAYSVDTDSSNNLYITGNTSGNLGGIDLIGDGGDAYVAKYNSDGEFQQVIHLGVSGGYTEATDIYSYKGKYLFLAGSTEGNLNGETINGAYDAFVTILEVGTDI